MRTQDAGAASFGLIHHRAHTGHSSTGFIQKGAHGRRQERRHAHVVQAAAHMADSLLALHGVTAHVGMGVHIHKAGQQIIPAKVNDGFARNGSQILADFGNAAIFQADAHPGHKFIPHGKHSVTQQHIHFLRTDWFSPL